MDLSFVVISCLTLYYFLCIFVCSFLVVVWLFGLVTVKMNVDKFQYECYMRSHRKECEKYGFDLALALLIKGGYYNEHSGFILSVDQINWKLTKELRSEFKSMLVRYHLKLVESLNNGSTSWPLKNQLLIDVGRNKKRKRVEDDTKTPYCKAYYEAKSKAIDDFIHYLFVVGDGLDKKNITVRDCFMPTEMQPIDADDLLELLELKCSQHNSFVCSCNWLIG